jgi:hypothetical protein
MEFPVKALGRISIGEASERVQLEEPQERDGWFYYRWPSGWTFVR